MTKKDILNYSLEEFTDILVENGFEKYRSKQVYPMIFGNIDNFDEINNIPKKLKEFLNENFVVNTVIIYKKLQSKKDYTKKYLMKLEDGNIIECVLMKYKFGLSACISSQVGCLMGCTFCASTIGSKVRNLTSGEMIGQILAMSKDVGQRISNIVIMGSGEPFDNYENFIKFLSLIGSEDTLNIGARHITVSTCGIADKIRDFADKKLQVNLAISLHVPTQEKREQIMPISRKFDMDNLMNAIEYYINKTNRRITYEYAIIQGFNDSDEDAFTLCNLVKKQLCHINIIPVNSTSHNDYKKPNDERIKRFINILSKHKVNATVRREMGADINGACGQLKISTVLKENL